MGTQCSRRSFGFKRLRRRRVTARFDGGAISSDGGGLLLGRVEQLTGIVRQFAGCFTDHRDADRIEHPLEQLIMQRVFGLSLGYEDLNDHDYLRHDPLLATLVGDADPLGASRRRRRDRGKALAGKSTLNRLELTPVGADEGSRYKKIVAHHARIDRLLVDLFIQSHRWSSPGSSPGITPGSSKQPPVTLVLDLDATDDPIHGDQLGRFFHGYYDCHCYLPLYITCGDHVLLAKLRPSNIDGAAGAVKHVARIVAQIREHWPEVRLILRGDSGFCREPLMAWCDANAVDYLFGLAKNKRLLRAIGKQMHEAKEACEKDGKASRVFTDLDYRTQKSWSRPRKFAPRGRQGRALARQAWREPALRRDLDQCGAMGRPNAV
jgi:hypothetical protein